MADAFAVTARAVGRGAGEPGELTMGREIGARFRGANASAGAETRSLDIAADKVSAVHWSEAPTGGMLRVRSSDGQSLVLGGMRAEEARLAAEFAEKRLGARRRRRRST